MRPLRIVCFLLLAAWTAQANAQSAFFRAADGKWRPLKTTMAGGVIKFSLAPSDLTGGSTLVILEKPKWMVLEDDAPPAVVKILLDGAELQQDQLALGWVKAGPREFVAAIKDDKNPLDLTHLQVTVNGTPLPAKQLTVTKLTPDARSVRVAVQLADLPQGRYVIELQIADQSPAQNWLRLPLSYNSAALLPNGGFEEVDKDGQPIGWIGASWDTKPDTKYELGSQPGGYAGARALRIAGLAGGLNLVCYATLTDLKAGQAYVLTGMYKAQRGAGLSAITTLAGSQVEYLNQSLPAAKDWTPFAWEFTLKAHDQAQITLRSSGVNEVWFDDVKLLPK